MVQRQRDRGLPGDVDDRGERREPGRPRYLTIGSAPRPWISPIASGRASAGVTTTSYGARDVTSERAPTRAGPARPGTLIVSWLAGPLPHRPGERLDVVSAGSRPAICPPTQVVNEISGPNARVKSGSRSRPDHGGVISSTSWPSDSSSAAASRRGLQADRVDRGALERRRGREPDPQTPGIDPSEPRRSGGRRGGAQVASPSSSPASTSSRAAVSATVRVSTPSETRKLCPPSGPTETRPRAGLRPDEPAARRRDPDRAAAVVAVRHRDHPGGDGRGRAAARTARRPVGVPRVAGRAEPARLGRRQDAHLRHRGLADDHEPGVAEPAHEERVVAAGRTRRTGRCPSSAASPRPAGCP